ncbi:MAG: exonuclease SbcCD subunit D C-terminal domain-containing protein [Bacteroidota bacterium]|nr:exonuclease SbcCD subunit D C-terminal domain-containing protein [Bacteroidota bacterium]
MKILHTSDWHLGHRLLEQSQQEEQSLFLDWLLEYIRQNNIDMLLVSGDIFDTGVPSAQGQKLYYDFLIHLRDTGCKEAVITGGNHDAPSTLNAPKELLNALSIRVVGKATENIEEEIFHLAINGEKIIVAAVPYLRDQDIRRAVASESSEEINNRYKTALIRHYTEAADCCRAINTSGMPIIALGHLFALGGSTSESEQTIYVGNLGDIGAEDFPPGFDYIALGHLHRAQTVGGKEHIRYSGSPYMLSFSEIGADKKVVVVETSEGKINKIEEVVVPRFRNICRVSGTVENCIRQLEKIDAEYHTLTPWVEVVLEDEQELAFEYKEISRAAEALDLEVLKVTLKNEHRREGLERLVENARDIKEITPEEVFRLKCKEQDFDLDNRPEMLNAFFEILQVVQENENA